MTDATVERTPAFRAVWREQLHVVGLSIQREVVIAAALLGLFCLAGVVLARFPALLALMGEGSLADFRLDPAEPGLGLIGVFAALLLPLIVWKGERPFGDTPIWSLPVDHRRHALTKVAVGWVWLMVILGGAFLCVVLATLAGGGALGADEVRQLITDGAAFSDGEAGATRGVAWTTPWWEWVQPFTAATAAYMLASALLLATAYPYRWAVVLYVLGAVPFLVLEFFEIDSLQRGVDLFAWFIGAEDFVRFVRLPTGEFARGWLSLPTMGMWIASAAFWISVGVACVVAASSRVRDH